MDDRLLNLLQETQKFLLQFMIDSINFVLVRWLMVTELEMNLPNDVTHYYLMQLLVLAINSFNAWYSFAQLKIFELTKMVLKIEICPFLHSDEYIFYMIWDNHWSHYHLSHNTSLTITTFNVVFALSKSVHLPSIGNIIAVVQDYLTDLWIVNQSFSQVNGRRPRHA